MDERTLENLVERIPAAPDQLYAMYQFDQPDFEARWQALASEHARQPGCYSEQLYREAGRDHYVTYNAWKSRAGLAAAYRAVSMLEPLLTAKTHQQFFRLCLHLGKAAVFAAMQPGQPISLRHYFLKVGGEAHFEALWAESARAELAGQPGCLFKRLHQDLNLSSHYMSQSAWRAAADAEEAAHAHPDWRNTHEPYPLARPVERLMLELRLSIPGVDQR